MVDVLQLDDEFLGFGAEASTDDAVDAFVDAVPKRFLTRKDSECSLASEDESVFGSTVS